MAAQIQGILITQLDETRAYTICGPFALPPPPRYGIEPCLNNGQCPLIANRKNENGLRLHGIVTNRFKARAEQECLIYVLFKDN